MRIRRWHCVVLVVVISLFLAKHFLLEVPATASGEYVIDVEALHRAAIASGSLPQSIEVEKVADFAFPRTLVVAGDGYRMHSMVLLSHRVLWPDRSVIIDTAMSPDATKKMPGPVAADAAAFDRVEKALRSASAIVFTHEHVDHVGGVASAPDPSAILDKVRITREQLTSPQLERGEFPSGVLERLVPFEYTGVHVVAPGIVLQKAPGHSKGTQLIYVELANRQRFLFVGDIAWTKDNIKLQTGRPGLITLIAKEDRPAVAAQLKAFAELPGSLHLVVAHDPVALEEDLRAGLYRMGFSVDSSP